MPHHNSHPPHLRATFNLDTTKDRRDSGDGRRAYDGEETEVERAIEGGLFGALSAALSADTTNNILVSIRRRYHPHI
jgi:hypothetical protein